MEEIRHLENRHDVISLRRRSNLDKMSDWCRVTTAVIWSKSKPEVQFQYGGSLGEFNVMSSKSHVPHCRVLPPSKFNATLQGGRTPSAILKIVLRRILFYFRFPSAVWASAFVSSLRYRCFIAPYFPLWLCLTPCFVAHLQPWLYPWMLLGLCLTPPPAHGLAGVLAWTHSYINRATPATCENRQTLYYIYNKCIRDDTKAAARQSLNCIENKK